MSNRVLMKGNEAIAEAAIRAGCRHYFGYPITPQTEIMHYMALRMPEVNGVELLRRLRAAGTDIPAIVVTGHADVQMAVEAIRHGAFDFIEKPFSDATIIGSLHRAMDGATIVADQRLNAQARVLVDAMSVRERDVMRGVVNGLPNKLIAENLGISPKAVEDHRSSLMERMQVRSLPELVRVTMDLEMLRESDGP